MTEAPTGVLADTCFRQVEFAGILRGTEHPKAAGQLIDYMVSTGGATQDMWVTRLEVGSEIDDNTKGSVSMKNVTFEVNKETRSPVFGQ